MERAPVGQGTQGPPGEDRGRVVRLQQSRREEVQSRPRHGETDVQQLVARRGQL